MNRKTRITNHPSAEPEGLWMRHEDRDEANSRCTIGEERSEMERQRDRATPRTDGWQSGFKIYSGAGNTFTCLDNRDGQVKTLPSFETDGLLLVENSDEADFRMRIFNPDGSEAEMCGNGLRCFKVFLEDLGEKEETYTVKTMHFVHEVSSYDDEVSCTMAPPNVTQWDPPLIDTGVLHAVRFVDDIDAVDVETVGPPLRRQFGANVTFVERVNPFRIKIRTFERGVEAETLACGTGATAAAVATRQQGEIEVVVKSGDTLIICVDDEGVSMTGPAHELKSLTAS